MAANFATELLPVLPIEDLPYAIEVKPDSKFAMSQDGMTMKVLGEQIAQFAQNSVTQHVAAAQEHAQAAQKAREGAESARDAAKGSASDAAGSAEKAQQYSGKPPIIQEGRWWVWNADKQEYEDTGEAARGNLMLPVFFLNPKTGLLTMYANQEYTGPDFRLRDGYLEVVLSA